ncbi:GGDEF domain-containing protein [Saccharothrix algeriensis]|uniref:Diguanylate cyclase (GGDEF)-like protein n=1 Tax=Saccharothrix algeriensis TaxID=173560 RepID=A0A8T8HXE5_9PSEU|nr:GGDEF domain-containing protein [Saccharothrix algeriensis]MBM7814883.1 diguanylate cyclase (GGDEF)-like protein [Saccharothrix algeriensis]QTR03158.1 GGDEF domain-containing protein [Saccharothrix algeriensis]
MIDTTRSNDDAGGRDAARCGLLAGLRRLAARRSRRRSPASGQCCPACGTPLESRWTLDGHTGLLVWGAWQDDADAALAWARRADRQCALLLVDLDRFKTINDSHGHLAGDAVLTAVADVLRSATRRGDVVGRYGGDEFVVLLAPADAAEASRIARRVTRGIRELVVPVTTTAGEVVAVDRLSASVGLALADEGTDLRCLLLRADAALLSAKRHEDDHVVRSIADAPRPRSWRRAAHG